MRERQIEQRLTQAVRKSARACVSPSGSVRDWTVPDRIILLPGGRIAFAELKAPGRPPAPAAAAAQGTAGSAGLSGLRHRQPGTDWRCAGCFISPHDYQKIRHALHRRTPRRRRTAPDGPWQERHLDRHRGTGAGAIRGVPRPDHRLCAWPGTPGPRRFRSGIT